MHQLKDSDQSIYRINTHLDACCNLYAEVWPEIVRPELIRFSSRSRTI